MIYNSILTFNVQSLWPLGLLLLVACIIPIILSILKIKMIPSLVIEIIAGIILSVIPLTRNMLSHDYEMNELSEGLYVIGMSILLFLSGLDTDFSVFKPAIKRGKSTFNVLRYSIISFLIVVILSLMASFIFYGEIEGSKAIGISLITILLSSTFASLVIPLVHDAGLGECTIGKIISTYATIAELSSIIGLSITMEILKISENASPVALVAVAIICIIIILVRIFIPIEKVFGKKLEGIVHLTTRILMCIIILSILLSDLAGVEYILGAFLTGMLIKGLFNSKDANEKIEIIGYGLFIPLFYILVGFKIGLMIQEIGIKQFLTLETFGLFMLLYLVMIIVKLPFAYLSKFYYLKTSFPTMLITTSTLIVSITIEHLSKEANIFNERFIVVMILASLLTVIAPPIIFGNSKTFDMAKEGYHDYIIEKIDIKEEI